MGTRFMCVGFQLMFDEQRICVEDTSHALRIDVSYTICVGSSNLIRCKWGTSPANTFSILDFLFSNPNLSLHQSSVLSLYSPSLFLKPRTSLIECRSFLSIFHMSLISQFPLSLPFLSFPQKIERYREAIESTRTTKFSTLGTTICRLWR